MVLDTVCDSLLLSLSAPQANWLIFQARVSFTVRQHVHVGSQVLCFMAVAGRGKEKMLQFWAALILITAAHSREENMFGRKVKW